MRLAITRDVSLRFNECEITHIDRHPIDVNVARAQHHGYVQALKELGYAFNCPPKCSAHSVFVEDTAVVCPVALSPTPALIRSLNRSIARAFYRPVFVESPVLSDDGDILFYRISMGLSTRSNPEEVHQMNRFWPNMPHKTGASKCMTVRTKSAVTCRRCILLINRKWVMWKILKLDRLMWMI
jgi:dimethylargininase